MLFTMAITSSCRKEVATTRTITKTVIDTVQHAWQADPQFNNLDQDISAAYAANNGKAFFYGMQYYYYVYDSVTNGWGVGNTVSPLANRRPAVNKAFFALANINNNFSLQTYTASGYLPGNFWNFKSFDTTFTAFQEYLLNYPLTNIVDISDSNRVLFPVLTTDNTKNYYYLLDTKISYTSTPTFTVSNFHKLALGSLNGTDNQFTTTHLNNRFFIGHKDTTYLVREDFSTKVVLNNDIFLSIFKYGGNYYATSIWGNIYKTVNNGENWTLQFTLSNQGAVIINFDGKLIAIFGSRFWLVTLGTTSISFKEIVNDGLTGKTISGLIKCNNKVWITTNGGVFYRPYSQFYQYK